jgi:hypothetical protein
VARFREGAQHRAAIIVPRPLAVFAGPHTTSVGRLG